MLSYPRLETVAGGSRPTRWHLTTGVIQDIAAALLLFSLFSGSHESMKSQMRGGMDLFGVLAACDSVDLVAASWQGMVDTAALHAFRDPASELWRAVAGV